MIMITGCRPPAAPAVRHKNKVVDDFHKLYYDPRKIRIARPWRNVTWLGQPIYKIPVDMINYQELIYQIQPDYIIETGTDAGGSAFFYASILDFIGHGKVITVGINEFKKPQSKIFDRVICLSGDSVSQDIHKQIQDIIGDTKNNIVNLDSDHTKDHVLKELHVYSQYVGIGNYIIVEDSNINGHPVEPNWGPGPYEAIDDFLATNHDFEIDDYWEKKHLISFSVNGYLRRIK